MVGGQYTERVGASGASVVHGLTLGVAAVRARTWPRQGPPEQGPPAWRQPQGMAGYATRAGLRGRGTSRSLAHRPFGARPLAVIRTHRPHSALTNRGPSTTASSCHSPSSSARHLSHGARRAAAFGEEQPHRAVAERSHERAAWEPLVARDLRERDLLRQGPTRGTQGPPAPRRAALSLAAWVPRRPWRPRTLAHALAGDGVRSIPSARSRPSCSHSTRNASWPLTEWISR